jgi:hypothetical protein
MDMSTPSKSDRPGSTWTWSDLTYAHVPGVDPELEWALGAGKDAFFAAGRQQRWMPVVIEVMGISVDEFAAGTGFLEDGPSRTMWQASVRVSPLYEVAQQASGEGTFCTAMVKPGFFEFLRRSESLSKVIVGVTLGLPLGAESLGPDISSRNAGHSQP